MKTYAICGGNRVRLLITTTDLQTAQANVGAGEILVETQFDGDPSNGIYNGTDVVPLPPKPALYMVFDFDSEQWVDPRTPETQWPVVRAERNRLLQESDWTDTYSAPTRLGQELYDAWQVYRQALRDITDQPDPFNIAWPTPPDSF
jgi:hypothetical protein